MSTANHSSDIEQQPWNTGAPTPETRAAKVERFKHVYHECYDDLWLYCLRRTASRSQAEEVLAKTFTAVWGKVDHVPSGHEAHPWIYGLARTHVRNYWRKTRHRNDLDVGLVSDVADDEDQNNVAGPETTSLDLTERIVSAFTTLQVADQEILSLASWEQPSTSHIGLAIGCTENAATTRLDRAVKRLSKALRKQRRRPAGRPRISMVANREAEEPISDDVLRVWGDMNPFLADRISEHPQPVQARQSLLEEIVIKSIPAESTTHRSTLARRKSRVWQSVAAAATVIAVAVGGIYTIGQGRFSQDTSALSEPANSSELLSGLSPVDPSIDLSDITSGVIERTSEIEENGQTTKRYSRSTIDGGNATYVFDLDTQDGLQIGPVWKTSTVFDGFEYFTDLDGRTVRSQNPTGDVDPVDELRPVVAAQSGLVENLAESPDYVKATLDDGWIIHTGAIERPMNMFDDIDASFFSEWSLSWTREPAIFTIVESNGVVVHFSLSVDSPGDRDADGRRKRSLLGTSTVTFSGLGEPQNIRRPSTP